MERISSFASQSAHILRVPVTYGSMEVNKSANLKQEEESIMQVFQRRGFQIKRGGQPNFQNPLEIGIFSRVTPGSLKVRDREIVQEAHLKDDSQVCVPKRYTTVEDVLNTSGPVVAKWVGHGGRGKFLLRSPEDKARFLAVAGIGNFLWPLLRSPDRDAKIHALLEKVKQRDFEDLIFEKALPYYTVEEYIQQPTEYNTSYRIVADAYGNIHYGLFLFKKRTKTIQKDYSSVGVFESVLRQSGNSYDLLIHPQSPLYIPSPDITSNHLGGGEKIRLRGEQVTDPLHRRILTAHGIDPDDPQIPRPLVEAAKIIGKSARYDYPFVGVDFLQQRGKKGTPKYYFLEANAGAAVSGFNLDYSEDLNSPSDMHIEMMRRVAACVPKDSSNEFPEQEEIHVITLPDEI